MSTPKHAAPNLLTDEQARTRDSLVWMAFGYWSRDMDESGAWITFSSLDKIVRDWHALNLDATPGDFARELRHLYQAWRRNAS